MPIIINDFEIIAEPLPDQPTVSTSGPAPPPPALHPEDIVRIVRQQQRRLLRVRAD